MADPQKYYKGRKGLKAAGVKLTFSADQVSEYIKCQNDPIYFIKNYCKIVHLDKGVIPFDLYDYQEDFINAMWKNSKTVLCTARQVGKTIVTASFFLWFVIFNPSKDVAILANKGATAKEIMDKVQKIYALIPYWLQPGLVEWNKSSMVLENKSRIICETTSANSIRGFSISYILLDEFAFVDSNKATEFFTSVYPTLSSGKSTKIVIASCVVKDTYIYSTDGIKQISDFIDDDIEHTYEIPTYSIQGKDGIKTGVLMHNNGKVPTKKVISRYSTLEGSHNHKLYAYKDGVYDWYRLDELSVGDYIGIKYGMNLWGSNNAIDFTYHTNKYEANRFDINSFTPEFSYFLGLYIAEGNGAHGNIDITCGDDVSHVFGNLGLRYSNTRDGGFHYRCASRSLVETMRHIGFDLTKTAKYKEIPTRLFSISKENIIALLQGMFDGDGCADKNRARVSYASTSLKLIEQLRIILINFGILSTIAKKITPPTEKVKVYSTVYVLTMANTHAATFFDEVGFKFERKQSRSSTCKATYRGNWLDVVPNSKNIFKSIKQDHSSNLNIFSGIAKDNIGLSRTTCLDIKAKLNAAGIFDTRMDDVIQPDICWVPILEVQESENYTYDFSLPDNEGDKWCHSVIYNGILGHQTPNGLNHFYKLYTDAVEGRNGFTPVMVTWQKVPGRDQAWADDMRKVLGDAKFMQEMEADFQGSSNTLISSYYIKKMVYLNALHSSDGFDMLIKPIPEHIYFITVDVSEGGGQDYSAFTVFDATSMPYQVCAKYRSDHIQPILYPSIIYKVGHEYNEAMVLIENNSIGSQVVAILHDDLEYENVIYTDKDVITQWGNSGTLGVKTTVKTKRIGCAALKTLVEGDQLLINDFDTVVEISTFVHWRNSYAADSDCNDDLVMTLVMFAWLTTQQWFRDYTDVDIRKLMFAAEERRLNDELCPFGFVNTGIEQDHSEDMILDVSDIWVDSKYNYSTYIRDTYGAI
jgi:hypothetical protein